MTREQLKQARRRRATLFLLAVLAVLAATVTVALSTGKQAAAQPQQVTVKEK